MTKPLFAVYGASGCGRGVMPLARDMLRCNGYSTEQLFFVDDNPTSGIVNGHSVLRYNDFLALPSPEKHIVLAIANSQVRQDLAARCKADSIVPWTVKAASAIVMDEVELGIGSILCPFVTLTSNIQIGIYFHANLYSYVEHDCIIGDYVTFAPAVKCNGNVVINDHAYIGAGAVIKQGKRSVPLVIGEGAVIGMGAVVTKSVPPGVTVVGNPARILRKK